MKILKNKKTKRKTKKKRAFFSVRHKNMKEISNSKMIKHAKIFLFPYQKMIKKKKVKLFY